MKVILKFSVFYFVYRCQLRFFQADINIVFGLNGISRIVVTKGPNKRKIAVFYKITTKEQEKGEGDGF